MEIEQIHELTEIVRLGNFFMTRSIAKLTQAMCGAVQEFGDVVKDALNPFFKDSMGKGKYADLSNYIEATRSQLAKHGLIIFQAPGLSELGPTTTTILSHISNEKIGFDLPMPVEKINAWGMGSGISYGRRYSYGPLLNVAGEDDDGQAAQATRKEHLATLEPQMDEQRRITPVQVKAFNETAEKNGRTAAQITQYLDELNGFVQVEEITKQFYEQAIKWALNQPQQQDLVGDLTVSAKNAELSKLWAIAAKKKKSKIDVHEYIKEHHKKTSVKDLDQTQYKEVIVWLESVTPVG